MDSYKKIGCSRGSGVNFSFFFRFFKFFGGAKIFRYFLCFQITISQSIYEIEKYSLFEQVRILQEIYLFLYPMATAATTAIVRHRIKTDQF